MSCGSCSGGLEERDIKAIDYHGLTRDGGRVRWLGLWWYGVPYPLRVLTVMSMAADLRRRGIPARSRRAMLRLFTGCGCIVFLKDAFDRVFGRPHAL